MLSMLPPPPLPSLRLMWFIDRRNFIRQMVFNLARTGEVAGPEHLELIDKLFVNIHGPEPKE